MRSKPKSESAATGAALAPSSVDPGAAEFRLIPVELLLEPLTAARETFDEAKLAELMESVRAVGILLPLIVDPEGDKYRVHAGHRRLIVARALHLPSVWCRVRLPGTISGEAVKVHENYFREDLNPAEEARFLNSLLASECGGDCDKLVALVKRPRDYVEGRLILLRGDTRVLDALAAGTIAIGVAHELNKIIDPARRMMYLDAAMTGGASVRTVREWRIQGNLDDGNTPAPIAGVGDAGLNQAAPQEYRMECFLCHSDEDKHEMDFVHVHRSCRRIFLRSFEQPPVAAPGER